MKPRVSITMPVLNGVRYIDHAVESILAQTYQDFELIIVDDGSTDATPQHIQKFTTSRPNVSCVRHAQIMGIARSVNDGLRHSSGEYIAFLDHDDAWLPEFLETQVRYLDEHPDVGMVHSDFQTIDSEGRVLEESVATCRQRIRPSGHVFHELFKFSFIVGNSVLIRKECFDRLGGFDESLRWGDYHMWMRIARNYKVDYVGKPLTQYRQHATQSTRTVEVTQPVAESTGIQTIKKILELYPEARKEIGEKVIRRRLASLYFDMAYAAFERGAYRHTRIQLRRSLRLWPTNSRYWRLYAATLLPESLAARVRGRWQSPIGRNKPIDSGSARVNRAEI